MNYIVDPSLIYWISISDNIRTFSLTILIISAIAVVFGILGIVIAFDVYDHSKKKKKQSINKITKAFYVGLIFLISSTLIYTLVPTKTTLVQMIIAKAATFENVAGVYKFTKQEISEAINYIFKGDQKIVLTNEIIQTNVVEIGTATKPKEKTDINEALKGGAELIKSANKTIKNIKNIMDKKQEDL